MIAISAIFWVTLAKANPYGFPPVQPLYPKSEILMHVEYAYGGGGTMRCPDLISCYTKRLDFEARGAEFYCRKITITENGKVRWWRQYQ